MRTLRRNLAALLLVLLFTGCASFERDWRHARLQPPSRPGSLAGPWEGNWLSDVNGHTGDLRCLVTGKGNNEYEFRFRATYWKIFRYSYVVNMPVKCEGTECSFRGTVDLGFLAGGRYHYLGNVAGTNLTATYRCKFDHGTFSLHRP